MKIRIRACVLVVASVFLIGCAGRSLTSPTPTLFVLPTAIPTELPPTPPALPDENQIIPTPTPLFGDATIASIGDHEPGICEHLLWPVLDGATWTYRLTEGDATSELTITAKVDQSGATLSSSDNISRMQCGNGILAGLPPLPSGHPALGMNISGNNPSGEYLPSGATLLPLGQPAQWDMDIEAAGAIRILQIGGDTPLPINGGRVAIIQAAQPLETVTVPAGEYLALPVQQDVLMDLQVQTEGVSVESVIVSATMTTYFVEGVGPVLVEYSGGTVSTTSGAWSLPGDSRLELITSAQP